MSHRITDQIALAHHRARSTDSALFLHEHAAHELEDRLSLVNRPFKSVAIATGQQRFWQCRWPKAVVVPDTETLVLKPGAHDLVLHMMALHWADDPVGQLIQCRHALQPDGLLMATCLGGQTLQELRRCLSDAEIEITGGLSPRIAPMADLRDMGGLLQRAGLALPVADNATLTAEYRDIWHLMHDLRDMGETNALAGRLRHPTRRQVFQRAADLYATNFATSSGRIKASFELLHLTGWAPDSTQPQPLRPGSATNRLADALGSKETSLPD